MEAYPLEGLDPRRVCANAMWILACLAQVVLPQCEVSDHLGELVELQKQCHEGGDVACNGLLPTDRHLVLQQRWDRPGLARHGQLLKIKPLGVTEVRVSELSQDTGWPGRRRVLKSEEN